MSAYQLRNRVNQALVAVAAAARAVAAGSEYRRIGKHEFAYLVMDKLKDDDLLPHRGNTVDDLKDALKELDAASRVINGLNKEQLTKEVGP